jgi:hypothetical protein
MTQNSTAISRPWSRPESFQTATRAHGEATGDTRKAVCCNESLGGGVNRHPYGVDDTYNKEPAKTCLLWRANQSGRYRSCPGARMYSARYGSQRTLHPVGEEYGDLEEDEAD